MRIGRKVFDNIVNMTNKNVTLRYCKKENLIPGSKESLMYTHLIAEAKSKFSTNLKPYFHTHDIIHTVESFNQITFDYLTISPIKIKTRPVLYILQRKENYKDYLKFELNKTVNFDKNEEFEDKTLLDFKSNSKESDEIERIIEEEVEKAKKIKSVPKRISREPIKREIKEVPTFKLNKLNENVDFARKEALRELKSMEDKREKKRNMEAQSIESKTPEVEEYLEKVIADEEIDEILISAPINKKQKSKRHNQKDNVELGTKSKVEKKPEQLEKIKESMEQTDVLQESHQEVNQTSKSQETNDEGEFVKSTTKNKKQKLKQNKNGKDLETKSEDGKELFIEKLESLEQADSSHENQEESHQPSQADEVEFSLRNKKQRLKRNRDSIEISTKSEDKKRLSEGHKKLEKIKDDSEQIDTSRENVEVSQTTQSGYLKDKKRLSEEHKKLEKIQDSEQVDHSHENVEEIHQTTQSEEVEFVKSSSKNKKQKLKKNKATLENETKSEDHKILSEEKRTKSENIDQDQIEILHDNSPEQFEQLQQISEENLSDSIINDQSKNRHNEVKAEPLNELQTANKVRLDDINIQKLKELKLKSSQNRETKKEHIQVHRVKENIKQVISDFKRRKLNNLTKETEISEKGAGGNAKQSIKKIIEEEKRRLEKEELPKIQQQIMDIIDNNPNIINKELIKFKVKEVFVNDIANAIDLKSDENVLEKVKDTKIKKATFEYKVTRDNLKIHLKNTIYEQDHVDQEESLLPKVSRDETVEITSEEYGDLQNNLEIYQGDNLQEVGTNEDFELQFESANKRIEHIMRAIDTIVENIEVEYNKSEEDS